MALKNDDDEAADRIQISMKFFAKDRLDIIRIRKARKLETNSQAVRYLVRMGILYAKLLETKG